MKKLSVIIVNFNVKYYLEQCLYSLFRSVYNYDTEVFVVDNASSDNSQEYLSQLFPQVNYIYNDENVGFGRANNQVLNLLKGEYVLVLNPDTIICEDTIGKIIAFMDKTPSAGAVGVKMITSDGRFLPESKRGIPSPSVSFWKLTGLQRLFSKSPRFGRYYLSDLDPDSIHEIEVLAGAFMFLRKTVVDKCGLFDEAFFMYGEDIDLSCRILQAGYKNYYLPYPILHYKGESTAKNSYRQIRVFYDAMRIFFKKNGRSYSFLVRWLVSTGIYLRMKLAHFFLFLKRISHQFENKTVNEPCFLVLAGEESIHSIQLLCKRNNLKRKHHYVLANQISSPNGHLNLDLKRNNFTHIVYDYDAYSFTAILELFSQRPGKNIQLGLYNIHTHVLITPEACYI